MRLARFLLCTGIQGEEARAGELALRETWEGTKLNPVAHQDDELTELNH